MGKRVWGLRSTQQSTPEEIRRKRELAEKTHLTAADHSKIFDENGKLIIRSNGSAKIVKVTNRRSSRMKKIKCTKCGKEKGISKRRLDSNIKKFGSEAELTKQYVCRECRAKDKPAKPKKEAAPKKEFKKTATGKKTAEELYEEKRAEDPRKAAAIDKLAEAGAEKTKNVNKPKPKGPF